MTKWQDEYFRKLVTADEAMRIVKSGDRVAFTHGIEPLALGLALSSRKEQLRDVKIYASNPYTDFGWYGPDKTNNFSIEMSYILPTFKERFKSRQYDLVIGGLTGITSNHNVISEADVLLTEVSPPNELGFCSFGPSVWGKRKAIECAKVVIAEVNKELIRTYGDNCVHV